MGGARMDLLMTWLPAFLVGARNTLIYCCISFPLALLLGLMLAEMKNARYVWLSMPAKLFIEAFRNTPIITQIFLIYYGVAACSPPRIWLISTTPGSLASLA